jgi:uncharacterized membrane protein YuzA (DUF378 family)
MWILDFPTLVLIIAASLYLGILGLFGYDAAVMVFGAHVKFVFVLVGASAVWQLFRQRLWDGAPLLSAGDILSSGNQFGGSRQCKSRYSGLI